MEISWIERDRATKESNELRKSRKKVGKDAKIGRI